MQNTIDVPVQWDIKSPNLPKTHDINAKLAIILISLLFHFFKASQRIWIIITVVSSYLLLKKFRGCSEYHTKHLPGHLWQSYLTIVSSHGFMWMIPNERMLGFIRTQSHEFMWTHTIGNHAQRERLLHRLYGAGWGSQGKYTGIHTAGCIMRTPENQRGS